MAIQYELHTIDNAQGSGEPRYFVQLRNGTAMTADELAAAIEESCSVTRADVKAVMTELCHFAVGQLSQGRRFYLPEIGYLSLSVGSVPPELKPDGKVSGKDIYLRNINFKPETKFLDSVRSRVSFAKSAYTTRSTQYGEDELWAKVEDYLGSHHYITCRAMRETFGLSDYMARQWLSRFTTDGRLAKEGTRANGLYFLKATE